RHIAGNRAIVNRYTIAAHVVMQHGSVRQVAQVWHIDALRPPTVVYAHHSLIAVLRALESIKAVVDPLLLLPAVLERRMRPLCGVELPNIGIQWIVCVEAVEQIFPVKWIITAGEALFCAVIHNRNAANSKGETERRFKLRPFIPVSAWSSSGVA